MSDCESSDGEVDFKPCLDVASLPKPVQDRVKALKNLQMDVVNAEHDYYKEVHQLDVKYQKMYDEINAKRTQILTGQYEPSGTEIVWEEKAEESEDGEEALTNGVDKLKLKIDMDEDAKGIPKFWMYALKNANEDCLMGMLEPHDEPVLEHLNDITVTLKHPNNTGFTLNFLFSENPFFSNTVLTKEYILREEPDPESPLEYDGPEIISCKGCTIDWKAGKDVTKTTLKVKKIKSRKASKGSPEKEITKEVKADSFFNFFTPPEMPSKESGEEMPDEDKVTLAADFDVGFAIKEKLIARAVLYFTGEAMEEEDDDDYEDVDTEDEDEDSDSDA